MDLVFSNAYFYHFNSVQYQTDILCHGLERRKFKVWYDNKMSCLTKQAMAAGVRESRWRAWRAWRRESRPAPQ